MKKKVLVFPAGTEIANEIISSLNNNKNYEVVLASSEFPSYADFRNETVHFLPFVSDDSFFSNLNDLICKENIFFIIPAHDDVAYGLSKIQNALKVKVIGQSYFVNNIVRFKDKTYEFFKGKVPLGNIYNNINEIGSFPIFIKPKKGQGSLDSYKINNNSDLNSFFKKRKTDDFVLMEYFSGKEYTVDCFSENGEVVYFGARSRDKTLKGISVVSTYIDDKVFNKEIKKYAEIISKELSLHGIWFFQMMYDENQDLKLLEIASRVSGSMMLNRARGMNFVEAALYQAEGYKITPAINDVNVSVGRSLAPVFKHNYHFDNLYVDFDDTLLLDETIINSELMRFIFDCKNENKKVYLITKNKKRNLAEVLRIFGISNIFDEIIHLLDSDKKTDFMKEKSLLVDDSFIERKQAIESGSYAIGIDQIYVF